MLFLKSVLVISLTGMASAGWMFEDTFSSLTALIPKFTDSAEAAKWAEDKSKKLESALETYTAHLATDQRYISAEKVFEEYVATRTDAPDILTEDLVMTYTTTPGWWKAMPTDIKEVYVSMLDDEKAMVASIMTDAAPKPTAMAKYAGVAVIAAGAAAIF